MFHVTDQTGQGKECLNYSGSWNWYDQTRPREESRHHCQVRDIRFIPNTLPMGRLFSF